jgi:outer membrane protein OmpA-like peptidoglycan-associated protein
MRAPEEELKRLLLASELDLLERIRKRCDELDARVGDDPALKESVRRVIVEVLRESGLHDHDRLARALAPLIVSSMREEIRNSRDMMVDALYPITGRLVAAAVRNAFTELMEKLNRKLDEGISVERWKAKLQAKATGRSEAEILLSRNPPFGIDEIFIIHRPTGLLIERMDTQADAADAIDSDLMSGMLTAIMAFVQDAFKDAEGGELRTLAFGESQLFLQTSPSVILAAKTNGTAPAEFETTLQELFFGILERWSEFLAEFDGDSVQDQKIAFRGDLQERFRDLQKARATNFRGRSWKVRAVIAIVLILVAIWPALSLYDYYRASAIEDRARRVIAAQEALIGYPIKLHYDKDTKALIIEGLLPSSESREQLTAELDRILPQVAKSLQLGSLRQARGDEVGYGNLASLQGELGRLKNVFTQALADLETKTQSSNSEIAQEFSKAVGTLERTLLQKQNLTKEDISEAIANLESIILKRQERTRRGLALGLERLESARRTLEQRLAKLEANASAPLRRLKAWTARHALFISDGSEFRDPRRTDALLGDLAALIKLAPSNVRIRVVGYTDSAGSERINKELSVERAKVVIQKLRALGVSNDRLIAVGRSTERSLAAGERSEEKNRRVEFEIAFSGE